eukprot:sb/3466855/
MVADGKQNLRNIKSTPCLVVQAHLYDPGTLTQFLSQGELAHSSISGDVGQIERRKRIQYVVGKPPQRAAPYTYQHCTTSKQPIRIRYLGHVTGYQPIRDQYFLTLTNTISIFIFLESRETLALKSSLLERERDDSSDRTSKQLIRTRYLGHVTGYQPIRDRRDRIMISNQSKSLLQFDMKLILLVLLFTGPVFCDDFLDKIQFSDWMEKPADQSIWLTAWVQDKVFQIETNQAVDSDGIRYDFFDATTLRIWFNGVLEVIWTFTSNDNGECSLISELLGFRFMRNSGADDTITDRYRYEIGRTGFEEEIGKKQLLDFKVH